MTGKLFNLKEWLILPDAARHLSIICGEQVTEADVLRLALDRKLQISVHFVNNAKARLGTIVRYTPSELTQAVASGLLPRDLEWEIWSDGKMQPLQGNLPPEQVKKSRILLTSISLGGGRYLIFDDLVTPIRGVWDLPMLGKEQLNIEQEFQKRTEGPDIILECFDGVFVGSIDGQLYQLVQEVNDEQFPFLKSYPVANLPNDGVLVVRTAALREFEQSINGATTGRAKGDGQHERGYVSDQLAAMNQAATKFWSNASPEDRATHPTVHQVATYLISRGFSQTLADKAAGIIRPWWAFKGRRPDE